MSGRAGIDEQAAEFLDALLEAIVRIGFPNRLGSLPECADAIQKLRDTGAVLPKDEDDGNDDAADDDDDDDDDGALDAEETCCEPCETDEAPRI